VDRSARVSSSGLAAWPLLGTSLLCACAGGQTGSEGQRHIGGGKGIVMCEPTSDAGVEDLYRFTPEDVQDIAIGTWSGRYPGGDFTGSFDVTVTVTGLDPALYVHSDDGVQLFQPHASDPDVEISEDDRESCVAMAVPAVVHVEASDPLFTLERDLRHVRVFGTSLRAEPFAGRDSETKHPPGVVTAGLEFNGPDSVEIEYWFIFGTDERLWVSVERDGTGTRYKDSGRRE
jgi:hypothetical protein